MVTGDNILTAISVARQCDIIPPQVNIYLGEENIQKQNHNLNLEAINLNSNINNINLPNKKYNYIIWKDFDFTDN